MYKMNYNSMQFFVVHENTSTKPIFVEGYLIMWIYFKYDFVASFYVVMD